MKIQGEKPKCDNEGTLRSCMLVLKSKRSLKAKLYLQFMDNNRLGSPGTEEGMKPLTCRSLVQNAGRFCERSKVVSA